MTIAHGFYPLSAAMNFNPLTVESRKDFFAQYNDGYEFYSLTKAFSELVTYKVVTKFTVLTQISRYLDWK